MNPSMTTVSNFYEAFGTQNWTKLRSLITDNFSFRGSMASFDNPDDFISAMSQLPFEGHPENSKFTADGSRVAHSFVWKMTSPTITDIHMCEVFEVEGDKVRSSELYYDSAAMPS